MLEELDIENLAVIEKACIRFQNAFHVFTGETGAGKSILIHGIQAVLGQRVSRDWVRTGCDRAVITALFTHLSEEVMQMLSERGISCEEQQITMTREIRADGCSIGRINGRTASVSALKEIGILLISIHGQHDNKILLNPENHLQILDEFGGNPLFLEEYQKSFRELQNVAKELGRRKKKEQERRQKAVILQKQIQEIGALHLKPGEEEELENALIQAENAERIVSALSGSAFLLDMEQEDSAAEQVRSALMRLQEIEDVYPETGEIPARLQSCLIELKDIAQDLQGRSESIVLDEAELLRIRQRYQAINQAKKQFFCDFEELLRMYETAKKEIQNLQEDTERISALETRKAELLETVTEKANALSEYRTRTAQEFSRQVAGELQFLDMPDVILSVQQEKGKLTVHGRDSVIFLISANKGEEPKPISKIASGGELSRIMLALKSVIAGNVPTLIFDEIDTGVSGRAAQKIGIKLREVSRDKQVLCVTHLSQIAVMADTQYLIEKHTEQERTVTQVHLLDFEGRIQEIARIMGGENPSALMLENAREELEKIVQKG